MLPLLVLVVAATAGAQGALQTEEDKVSSVQELGVTAMSSDDSAPPVRELQQPVEDQDRIIIQHHDAEDATLEGSFLEVLEEGAAKMIEFFDDQGSSEELEAEDSRQGRGIQKGECEDSLGSMSMMWMLVVKSVDFFISNVKLFL